MAERTIDFRARSAQDEMLRELNCVLARAEGGGVGNKRQTPQQPMVFIVGAPRSGTTLMLQWLAASKRFAYPSNLLARFFGAPYIGSRIQQLLTDPDMDYRDELLSSEPEGLAWISDVGKTRGMLQPHEFSYYWRRFFPIDQAQKLTDAQLEASDPEGFAAGWAAIEAVFGKPIAAKGILLQYNLAQLAQWLPKSIFVHTQREPVHNIRSLLRARHSVYGTHAAWFSVRPPEFEWLKHEDPYTQVAGQVLFTNESITRELALLMPHRAIPIEYEAFCREPAQVWARLQSSFRAFGFDLEGGYDGPASFECTNATTVSKEEEEEGQVRAAYERLAARQADQQCAAHVEPSAGL
ncbi:MAG: sulfotransferase family protein [Luteitalea sp.]|nr:sulfotransferase family protein [Luteitalea sp.]